MNITFHISYPKNKKELKFKTANSLIDFILRFPNKLVKSNCIIILRQNGKKDIGNITVENYIQINNLNSSIVKF